MRPVDLRHRREGEAVRRAELDARCARREDRLRLRDHVARRPGELEKLAEVDFVEFFGRRELPQHRAEPVAKFEHAGVVEALHRVAGLGQHSAIGGEARPFQREHKAVGHLARPLAKALGLLRTVVGAVDLDRGEL